MRDRDAGLLALAGLALLAFMRRSASGASRHKRLVWYWMPGTPGMVPVPMWVASDFKGESWMEIPNLAAGWYRAEDSETDQTMDDSRSGYISDWAAFWRTGYPSWAQKNEES